MIGTAVDRDREVARLDVLADARRERAIGGRLAKEADGSTDRHEFARDGSATWIDDAAGHLAQRNRT